MSGREEILRRLRAASFDAPLPDVAGPPVPAGAAQTSRVRAEVVALFVERARAVGAEVVRTDAQRLPHLVAHLVTGTGGGPAAVWKDEDLVAVTGVLREAGVTVLAPPYAGDALSRAPIGITTADYAIAETGTLVLACGPDRPRAASLLPPRHVAVLREDRIVPTLFELVPYLGPLPSALTFITGPSRTADIELTPVRGVHGPVAVHVFLVADAPREEIRHPI